jgi:hypothetical protein
MSTFARDFFFADPKRSELLQIAAKAFFLVEVASLATRSRSEEQKINILEKSHFSIRDISFKFLCFFQESGAFLSPLLVTSRRKVGVTDCWEIRGKGASTK